MRCLLSVTVHPIIIIPIVVSLEQFEKDLSLHYTFISLDPQDTINRLQFGHQNEHTVGCMVGNVTQVSFCPSHGTQASGQQASVHLFLNHKVLKILRKHVEMLQLKM